ncbi:MAG: hypothetical protein ABSE91_01380 [Patescibacteria group bacterium]|jgi:predicted transcriptional regulator
MIKIKDTGQFEFLFGKKKAQFLRFCEEKKEFYQAEVAKELGWSIGATQYYCRNFAKHHFLKAKETDYRTYYVFNPSAFHLLV